MTDLMRFYGLLDRLEKRVGKRRLADCTGRMSWPERGVYFFFEPGETRSDSGGGPRVVRVGTHALKVGGRTRLWTRLSQHKGTGRSDGGNHRGSIFRLLVGTAIMGSGRIRSAPSWGKKGDLKAAAEELGIEADKIRASELPLEVAVSDHVRSLPFLWVDVGDESSPQSDRGIIERNSIGLLSNFGRAVLDAPSSTWLGHYCNRERVRTSGLWNNNHVEETYDPAFLKLIEHYIDALEHN
ncbi:MAG: hypothetical protein ACREDZ_00325 [Kiloniellales bacterium]